MHDDAFARAGLARLVPGEISGEMRPPIAVRARSRLAPCSVSEENAISVAAMMPERIDITVTR